MVLRLTLQKPLDRCYTRMLRAVPNIDQNQHVTEPTSVWRATRRAEGGGSSQVLWGEDQEIVTHQRTDALWGDAGITSQLARCMRCREDWENAAGDV